MNTVALGLLISALMCLSLTQTTYAVSTISDEALRAEPVEAAEEDQAITSELEVNGIPLASAPLSTSISAPISSGSVSPLSINKSSESQRVEISPLWWASFAFVAGLSFIGLGVAFRLSKRLSAEESSAELEQKKDAS